MKLAGIVTCLTKATPFYARYHGDNSNDVDVVVAAAAASVAIVAVAVAFDVVGRTVAAEAVLIPPRYKDNIYG